MVTNEICLCCSTAAKTTGQSPLFYSILSYMQSFKITEKGEKAPKAPNYDKNYKVQSIII